MSRRPNEDREVSNVHTLGVGPAPQGRNPLRRASSRASRRLLTLVVAAGLGVDAYVHWQLAPGFDGIQGTGSPHISQGGLFRLEAFLALIAMLLVLLTRSRLGALVAFLVAAGGLGAVLLYAYVDVGALGPLPNMYDPIWYPEKTISAIAEAVAAVGALALLTLPLLTSSADSSAS
jgi:hypothetical protein